MKLNILHPNINTVTLLNLLKVLIVVIASQSGMGDNMHAFGGQIIRQTIQRSGPIFQKASPVARTLVSGLAIPFSFGYGVRTFEEHYDFRGRDGFHEEGRHDLMKMGHYAFHTCNMAALIWGIRKLTKTLPDDIRAASVIGGIYFYGVGRQFIMDPAESRLMIALKYMPGISLGIVAVNRIPFLRKNIALIGSVTGMAAAFHLMGFH